MIAYLKPEVTNATAQNPAASLVLFGVRNSPSTERAIANLKAVLEDQGLQDEEITFVDILERPECSYDARIFATPTLIIKKGDVSGRFVGTLDATDQLRAVISRLR